MVYAAECNPELVEGLCKYGAPPKMHVALGSGNCLTFDESWEWRHELEIK